MHCSSRCQNTAAVQRLRKVYRDSKAKRRKLAESSKKQPARKKLKKGGT